MKGKIHLQQQDDIALIELDNPPVNALSAGLRQGLYEALEGALADDVIRAVIIWSAQRAWCAGADISEFGDPSTPSAKTLHDLAFLLDAGSKPVVAAIHATAFGGGLELALCCDYRVGLPDAQLALPEVKIGILPGASGTQRLPRLIGVEQSLDFILKGDPVSAAQAHALGVIDELVEGDIVAGATKFARELIEHGAPVRKIPSITERLEQDRGHPEYFENARALIAKRYRGRHSPEMIVRAVEVALANIDDYEAGRLIERELSERCHVHPESKALQHVFFAERKAGKIPDVDTNTPRASISRSGVIGCGTMGGGIAMNLANAGVPVTVLETDEQALERGLNVIRGNYERSEQRGSLPPGATDQRMALIIGTTDYADLGSAELVIEAVYENLELKQKIFARLEEVLPSGAFIASNTSALDIDQMAAVTSRASRVLGMHFFSPANVMRLVEVVRGAQTSPETLAMAFALVKRMNKVGVLSANADGFIGNHMLAGYVGQARQMIMEGALPAQIDKVIRDFGLPMGPFQMYDLVGLDLGWRARKLAGKRPEDVPPGVRIDDLLCELGRYGQKNGCGFYRYEKGNRRPLPDPEVDELIVGLAAESGFTRREFSDEEILKRCIYALINVGAQLLDDGVALRPSDIDVVYINGYGFPAYRGGPMYYADTVGVGEVHADIERFHAELDEAWRPAPLLARLAGSDLSMSSLQEG